MTRAARALGLLAALLASLLVPVVAPAASSAAGASTPTAPSPGCDHPHHAGVVLEHAVVDGTLRQWRLEVPRSSAAGHPTPMVVLLHGWSGDGAQIAALIGFESEGARHGLVVVSPDGLHHTWGINASDADARLLSILLTEVPAVACVDTRRVDLAGFSAGAAEALTYACHHPRGIAAIATVAVDFQMGCTRPVSYLAFHGTTDHAVPFADGAVGASLPGLKVRGTWKNLGDWARLDRCAARPRIAHPAQRVIDARWHACAHGSSVELVVLVGDGHSWPGADPRASIEPTSRSINATSRMVALFSTARSTDGTLAIP
jgi:polyhydroxybutyrate depolymerase